MPKTLSVDHDLYIAVVEFFADLDNGEEKFAFENAHFDFIRTPAFRVLYEEETGDALSHDRLNEVHMFVAAAYLVNHHNWNMRFYREQPEAVSAFIATYGFTFLTAWTQRYGPLEGDRYTDSLLTPYQAVAT